MARVLIVDDDEQDLLLQRHILQSAGHELYYAKNGAEAMRLFIQKNPEVVVTDLKMPGGDGIELIEALIGIFAHVQIIALTGTTTELLSTAKKMGARTTLMKPVSRQALLDAVAEASAAHNAS